MKILPLPPLLVELISNGRWRQPSDDAIIKAVPFLSDPVDFLLVEAQIRRESKGTLADNPQWAEVSHMYRGSMVEARPLPWLDADMALMIAVNREAGADVGIALDCRANMSNPKVVASEWIGHGKETRTLWREVSPTFSKFIEKVGL